ncbi:MAG: DUF4091 domain-containing protein [Treponema sp.]|nr:DUF4091 domain-containing protein [Treponema sp.]
MYAYDIFLANSLEKVFPSKRPHPMDEDKIIPVFEGTIPAVQLVYTRHPGETPAPFVTPLKISVTGAPVKPALSSVELIPADYPCHEKTDSGYLTTEPGLFPDLLRPLVNDTFKPVTGQYRSIWIDFPGVTAAMKGIHKITVKVETLNETVMANGSKRKDQQAVLNRELSFFMDVKPQILPVQTLIQTQWFHADCLADFYKTEIFGEEHWKIIEAFIEPMVSRYGINMALTPVFTPPLDTEPGAERPTVQLVDIETDGDKYSFNFDKLICWCNICKKHSIKYLEIPHFFTQWGAAFTPKIIARSSTTARSGGNGELKRIFGWDVKADDPAYANFLRQLVPALRKVLEENGYDRDHVVFHVSDEPNAEHIKNYKAAKELIAPLVKGSLLVDALSDVTFYREGIVEHPIPAVNHVKDFLDAEVRDLWTYYCTGQYYLVPNRFFAMPSARTRAMGILMYYFNIKGFLQWGYNFYYSQNSKKLINPFCEASGIRAWPAGDPFLVYPGEDGRPLSSIRGEVHRESLEDYRLLCLAENKMGREKVLALAEEDFHGPLSFEHYPAESQYYYKLREKLAQLLGQ